MKILMVTHGFAPECSGGTESYVLDLCQELKAQGHEIHVLCGSHAGAGPDQWYPRVVESEFLGFHVIRVHRTGLYVDNWEKSFAPEVDLVLRGVLERLRPDVVHVHHWIRLSRTLVETCHDMGVPVVCTLHDLWTCCPKAFRVRDDAHCSRAVSPENCVGCALPPEGMGPEEAGHEVEAFRQDFQNELSLARRLIVPSVAHRDVLLRHHPHPPGKFRVIPHGRNPPFSAGSGSRSDFPSGKLRIGHWGHLTFLKGLDVLLEALRLMDHPNRVHLELFGEVVYPQEKARAESLLAGLPVTRHGAFSPNDLVTTRLDLAIIPSRCSESWSFVLDEAFLLGIPAIVSDIGALSERLRGAGATIPVGDAAALAVWLDRVVMEPGLLSTWKAAIPTLPSATRHAAAVAEVYRDVLTLGSAPSKTSDVQRTVRGALKARQIEARNRLLEDKEARIGHLGQDLQRAQQSLSDMERHHHEKDRVIVDQARAIAELETRIAKGPPPSLVDDLHRRLELGRAERGALEQAHTETLGLMAQQQEGVLRKEHDALESLLERIVAHGHRLSHQATPGGNSDPFEDSLEECLRDWEAPETNSDASLAGAPIPSAREGLTGSIQAVHERTHELLTNAAVRHRALMGRLAHREGVLRVLAGTVESLLRDMEATERKRRRESRPLDPPTTRDHLKVLMVVHQYVPRHVAGTEIYAHSLATALKARGHEVVIVTAESDHSLPRFTERSTSYDGIRVREVIHNYRWTDFRDTYDCPEFDAIFRRIMKEEQPDVLHVQHLHYLSANLITIAKNRGVPVVFTLHDYMSLCPRDGTLRRADGEVCLTPDPARCRDCISHHPLASDPPPVLPRALRPGADAMIPPAVMRTVRRLRWPTDSPVDPYEEATQDRLDYMKAVLVDVDEFLAPSQFLKDRYVESGLVDRDRVIVSDNGYDRTRLPKRRTQRRRPGDPLRVGYMGTIAEHKGVHLLIEALNRISDPRVSAQIWGDLRAFVEYSESISSLIRNPNVLLMGAFRPEFVDDVLARIDLLVVPSLWFENSPLTVHEAAAAGVPVLCSDQGGLAEYVLPETTGRHFRLGDVEDLRRKIEEFVEHPLPQFDPSALPIKSIEEDAAAMEQRYRRLVERERILRETR